MKIRRLFIKDFGIFHNELLEDIAPGLVVIGGHNRAGKTTFLELLRYLPFGFPRKKKNSLQPATGMKLRPLFPLITMRNSIYIYRVTVPRL
mgnify:CR=1 FL=1